jgi:serine/threonine-protein kinase RsbW
MHSALVLSSGRHWLNTISEMILDLPEEMGSTEKTANWKSKDGDRRVTVIGDLGVGPDGRHYVSVLDAHAGLPVDELEFEESDRGHGTKEHGEWEVGMSANALHKIEPERGPIWQYRATIPAAVDSISTVMDQVMELGEETECFGGREMAIETALREALANAIVHGCQNDERQTVQLSVACHQDLEIEMVVQDSGRGFDPKSIPDPTKHTQLHVSHGRGLFLIEQFMDEVRHRRGGTEIFMRKR